MPAFGLVVNDKREILLIQRGYGKDKGKWSLPGGMRDKGESLKDTAVRETAEETGIKMSADTLYYRNKSGRLEVWHGRSKGGRLIFQKKECWDAKWFPKDMLPHADMLAFGPDKIVMNKWATESPDSRRVHYPRAKMQKAGFALVVNERLEVLLIREGNRQRRGSWRLPGGVARHEQGRMDTARRETRKATGVEIAVQRLYYENRHDARIYLAKPVGDQRTGSGAEWFSLSGLPSDQELAFAVDVRTIEKWARENGGSRVQRAL